MSVVLVTYLSISCVSVLGMEGSLEGVDLSTSGMEVRYPPEFRSEIVTQEQASKPAAKNEWYTSFEEASQAAIRTKRPLLLHFEAPWCGACRQMEASVLNSAKVKVKLGRDVIGVRLNADVNQKLIAKFGISTLPTEVVVLADGSKGEKYVGATSLSSYLSRLDAVSGQNDRVFESKTRVAESSSANRNLRSCLIVTRNGQMVGLGGFSPVSLRKSKAWQKGTQEFVASHEGVDYYLTSAAQVTEFQADPEAFIPKFHGCDLVTLRHDNEARTGAIEYGAFYDGHMYFFASTTNRDRFQKNPLWYLQGSSVADLLTPEMLATQEATLN